MGNFLSSCLAEKKRIKITAFINHDIICNIFLKHFSFKLTDFKELEKTANHPVHTTVPTYINR